MIRKLFYSMVVMTVCLGFVAADEFTGIVTKIDGDKVTYFKTKKGKKDGDAITTEAVKDVKVNKGTKDGKKWVAGDAIEGGLKAKPFEKIDEEKGVLVRIITDDDKKNITQILVIGKK
jgi:hypothetical protein